MGNFRPQGYGNSLDIEAGKYQWRRAAVKAVESDSRRRQIWIRTSCRPPSAERAPASTFHLRKSPSIEVLNSWKSIRIHVSGMKDKAILDMGPEDLLEQGDQVLTRVTELVQEQLQLAAELVLVLSRWIVTSSGIEVVDYTLHTELEFMSRLMRTTI